MGFALKPGRGKSAFAKKTKIYTMFFNLGISRGFDLGISRVFRRICEVAKRRTQSAGVRRLEVL